MKFKEIKNKVFGIWRYFREGVWRDTRSNIGVNTVKTISLAVNSFLNTDLQSKACALAFRTMLALVPALALLFAIGRGFGFQTLIEDELYGLFPAQRDAISVAIKYVDSYLNTASEGVFVGIGIVFLLYTLINLISNVEGSFNDIWGIRVGRSIWRKVTDYTAMLLILPVLIICASGISFFMSSTLQSILDYSFMTPFVSFIFDSASWVLMWLFFTAAYVLIPNTQVRLKNALIAGILAGSGFMILQDLFVTGQIYVTKYNAIYGSFAFVPLLLIWLQLTWVITLSGALLSYSSQNIFQFSFSNEINSISLDYKCKVTLAIAVVITRSFVEHLEVPTKQSIIRKYGIPSRLTNEILDQLISAGIINQVILNEKKDMYGYTPAIEPSELTVGRFFHLLGNEGTNDFIPDFNSSFPGVNILSNDIEEMKKNPGTDMKIYSKPISEIDIKL